MRTSPALIAASGRRGYAGVLSSKSVSRGLPWKYAFVMSADFSRSLREAAWLHRMEMPSGSAVGESDLTQSPSAKDSKFPQLTRFALYFGWYLAVPTRCSCLSVRTHLVGTGR